MSYLHVLVLSMLAGACAVSGGDSAQDPRQGTDSPSASLTSSPIRSTLHATPDPSAGVVGGPFSEGRIVFLAMVDGNQDIFTIEPDGSNLFNVTNHPALDTDFVVSPDGTRVAYTSDREGNSEIYVQALDGSSPRNVSRHPAQDYLAEWSHDGTRLAYLSNRDGNEEIYVSAVDGSETYNLTNNPASDGSTDKKWSPVDDRIAFTSDRDGGLDIFITDTSGGDAVNVTPGPGDDAFLDWSPDGARLAFTSQREGGFGNIFVLDIDSAELWQVTSEDGEEFPPLWSPDGRRIAYQSWGYDGIGLRTVKADGTDMTELVDGPTMFGDWSPDGSAFVLNDTECILVYRAPNVTCIQQATVGGPVAWAPGD